MPGLTLNTEAAVSRASQQPSSGHRTSASAANPPTRTFQSTTPIPVPIPYASREQQQPQLQLQPPQPSPRSSSPVRPTYSPITPPLNAARFPSRPTYTHSSHVGATAVPPPPPEPIDFDSNPDVLALKSAISILQMQRRKAERDMAALDRVKAAALAEPGTFVRDLTAGRVRVEGEGLFVGSVKDEDDDSDSSSDSGSEEGDMSNNGGDETKHIKSDAPVQSQPQPQPATKEEKPNIKADPDADRPGLPPWTQIPKPQNVVRCPPINWSQYAVVGESLDKLHNEQVRRPAQGTPATLTPEGHFEFKGGDGKQEQYNGVAAPYAPGRDRIDGKSKLPSRR
ncbi:hypothetical protein F4803DRAFT_499633 [Xylaria telfairii]|nr:hypothetical protein F4803DRAFT_499633 [Xylaria telfairii]